MVKVLITGTSCGVGRAAAVKFLDEGYEVVRTREPGGSKIAEDIRNVILDVNNIVVQI